MMQNFIGCLFAVFNYNFNRGNPVKVNSSYRVLIKINRRLVNEEMVLRKYNN